MNEPQSPVNIRPRGVPHWPLIVALFNASGLGLGYLYMKAWRRWGLHTAVTAVLVSIPLFGGRAWWLIALVLWDGWMILDGWLHARRLVRASPDTEVKKNIRMALLAAGVSILALLPFLAYNILGAAAVYKAETAYRSGEYRTVYEMYENGSRLYVMTFTFDKSLARECVETLDTLMIASAAWENKDYETSVHQFAFYLASAAHDAVWDVADNELQQVYLDWARSLAGEKKYEQAIGIYDAYMEKYTQGNFAVEAKLETEQAYLAWAGDLAAQGDYEGAINIYQAYLRGYPDGSLLSEAKSSLEKTRFDQAHAALEEQDYQNAVDFYMSYLLYYPDSAFKADAEHELEEARLGLARATTAQGDFEEAATLYLAFLQQYPESEYRPNVESELEQTRIGQARVTAARGDFEEAITLYLAFIQQYPESEYQPNVESELEQARINWARQVAGQKSYEKAMELYLAYLETYPQGTQKTEADEELQQVYMDWSRDTGNQGKAAIVDAYESAANGEATEFPIIGILDDEPPMAWYSGTYLTLPDDITATKPGHFRTAVFIEEIAMTVHTCTYFPTGIIIQERIDWLVGLVNPATGVLQTYEVFFGGTPGSCPLTLMLIPGATNMQYRTGSPPSQTAVVEWIRLQLDWMK